MKIVYTLLRFLTVMVLMSWITFCLLGFTSIFVTVSPGMGLMVGLGVWIFFVGGMLLCQKGWLLHVYLPRFLVRNPTPQEISKLEAAEAFLKTIKEDVLKQGGIFKKIYITENPSAQLWVYGGHVLVIPYIVIHCPTEGVLEGALFHAYEQKLCGEGIKRSLRVFLTVVGRGALWGKRAVEVTLFGPIHQKFSQGKLIVFTREVVAWTAAALGVLPWGICMGICGLIKVYSRLCEQEEEICLVDTLSSGSRAVLYYNKYLSFQEAMPRAHRDIFGFGARRRLERDKNSV